MTRLLADENFPYPVVEALRRFGFDVLTLADLGVSGRRWPTTPCSTWRRPTRERY
ncbi:MAG TPA: DUF5615 family PIN-like protein [Vicinamibacterales bacterium]|nr:DUF5615 family PIN-like protein [Vicinamibacterales bacterium]